VSHEPPIDLVHDHLNEVGGREHSHTSGDGDVPFLEEILLKRQNVCMRVAAAILKVHSALTLRRVVGISCHNSAIRVVEGAKKVAHTVTVLHLNVSSEGLQKTVNKFNNETTLRKFRILIEILDTTEIRTCACHYR
jgi:hypothetical protein